MFDCPFERVLTVVTNLDKGGVQRTSQLFACGYRELGLDSRVLAVNGGGERQTYLEDQSVPYWIGLSDSSLNEIAEWSPDLVHAHSHKISQDDIVAVTRATSNAIIVEKNVFSTPTAVTPYVHCSFQMSHWCEWRYRHARHTRNTRQIRTAIVPNAANSSAFYKVSHDECVAFRRTYRIPSKAIVIGRVGQADIGKWSSILIDSFDHLCETSETLLHLLLVNAPTEIIDRANISPFSSRITIIDRLVGDAALRAAYSAMDVFALAADYGESFGNVIAESLLCETPAVVLSTPWAHNSQCEVVGHQIGGLVATTPSGFTAAIGELLRIPNLRESLGKNGRNHIIESYDFVKVARQALNAASETSTATRRRELRDTIVNIYRDAYDRPSRLACMLLSHPPLNALLKYTSGHASWRNLPANLCSRLRR